jgi:hypothetical protein
MIGSRVGHDEIRAKLGEGGMGEVRPYRRAAMGNDELREFARAEGLERAK